MLNNQKLNPIAQFAFLLVFAGAGIMLYSSFVGLIANYVMHVPPNSNLHDVLLKPGNLQYYRIIQFFSSFIVWGLPPIAVAAISGPDPIGQLGSSDVISIKQIFFVMLMVFFGIMFSGAFEELNRLIPISKEWANYFQKLENEYNKDVMSLANMKTTNDYIFTLIILALTPALFEELFFRGCLQQTMISIIKKPFWGIFITSVLFSAVHLSFYGFLSRLFLGLMLGYVFYFSKNLWLNILVHFLNNAFAVTMLYSLSRSGKLTPASMDDSYPLYYGLIAVAALLTLFVYFKKESDKLLLQPEQNRSLL
jgi:membrane protease YdiL (CAAX protease family)